MNRSGVYNSVVEGNMKYKLMMLICAIKALDVDISNSEQINRIENKIRFTQDCLSVNDLDLISDIVLDSDIRVLVAELIVTLREFFVSGQNSDLSKRLLKNYLRRFNFFYSKLFDNVNGDYLFYVSEINFFDKDINRIAIYNLFILLGF
jgi:hypothetical protein